MRTWLRRVLLAFAALVGLLFAVGVASARPLPSGEPGPAADALARRMEAAVNRAAWERTGAVRWVHGGRQRHLWDRVRGYDRVEFNGAVAWIDLATQTGRVMRRGEEVTGEEGAALVARGWAWFCNDSFWLNPVVKAFDDGVTREALADGRLLVRYHSGGVTPGDAYAWQLGPDGTPTEWRMWVQVLPIPGVKASWEDWVTLPTGARVATSHRLGPLPIRLTELEAAATLAALDGPDDPFAVLLDRSLPLAAPR